MQKHCIPHRCYPHKGWLDSDLTLSMLEMRLITRTEVQAVTRCVGNIGSNMEGKCFTEDLCYRDLYKCSPKKFFKKFVENNFRAKELFVHKKFDEEIDGQKKLWGKKFVGSKKLLSKKIL